jgi:bacterioferritin
MQDLQVDIEALRDAARAHIDRGPITDTYGADRERVVNVLNSVLATELVCVLRYKRHYYMADGMKAIPVAAEFLQHATEEQGHADLVAQRIVQLQGAPDFNPSTLTARSHAEYEEGSDLASMVEEDLVAERIAISTYQEIARWLGDDDPTTRRLIEQILAVEEEHAEDLVSLLKDMPEHHNGDRHGRAEPASPARVADPAEVAKHEREMDELGADARGEGQIV